MNGTLWARLLENWTNHNHGKARRMWPLPLSWLRWCNWCTSNVRRGFSSKWWAQWSVWSQRQEDVGLCYETVHAWKQWMLSSSCLFMLAMKATIYCKTPLVQAVQCAIFCMHVPYRQLCLKLCSETQVQKWTSLCSLALLYPAVSPKSQTTQLYRRMDKAFEWSAAQRRQSAGDWLVTLRQLAVYKLAFRRETRLHAGLDIPSSRTEA